MSHCICQSAGSSKEGVVSDIIGNGLPVRRVSPRKHIQDSYTCPIQFTWHLTVHSGETSLKLLVGLGHFMCFLKISTTLFSLGCYACFVIVSLFTITCAHSLCDL